MFWQAKRTLKAHRLQDELASGKLDQTVSVSMLGLKEDLEMDHLYLKDKLFICRKGSTTVKMRMKINTQMTLTCLVKTLTPREESLSEICVSERTRQK